MLLEEKCIVIFLHNRPFFGAQLAHIPFLVMLRQQYQNAKLVGVSKNKSANFLVEAGFLDYLEIVETKKQFSVLKNYRFDIGFNLRPSSIGVAFQMLLLKIPLRIGFKKFGAIYTESIPLDITIYRANLFLKLLCENCISTTIPYLNELISKRNEILGGILIVPGSGGEEKKWPIEKYMLLADKFFESGQERVFFITGPQELKEQKILEKKGYKVINNPGIDLLFNLVKGCDLFISNDCGPSHVAHILGVKQIVLFNKFLPEWFLERANSRYISSSLGVSFITVDEVIEVAQEIEQTLTNI